jgi:hypothetical protein
MPDGDDLIDEGFAALCECTLSGESWFFSAVSSAGSQDVSDPDQSIAIRLSNYGDASEIYPSPSGADQFQHVAWQGYEDGRITVHYMGVKIYDETLENEEASLIDFAFGITKGSFAIATAIGQIKLSNSALYGTGNFTPPTEAFYVPLP